jgi:D-tyrosyl-tRNA(Tyr) deacylase
MIFVIQRVQKASIEVENKEIASIQKGLLAYVGIVKGDGEKDLTLGAKKLSGLRIFEGPDGKMRCSAGDNDQFLLISQFTLCGSIHKGFRPDFFEAETPVLAKELFDQLCTILRTTYGRQVKTGAFGEDMHVFSHVDGPVTIYFNTRKDK